MTNRLLAKLLVVTVGAMALAGSGPGGAVASVVTGGGDGDTSTEAVTTTTGPAASGTTTTLPAGSQQTDAVKAIRVRGIERVAVSPIAGPTVKGGVWVTTRNHRVVQIDATTGKKVGASVRVPVAEDIAVTESGVYVAGVTASGTKVSVIDAGSGKKLGAADVSDDRVGPGSGSVRDLEAGYGGLWLSYFGPSDRIRVTSRPAIALETTAIRNPGQGTTFETAVGEDAFWMLQGFDAPYDIFRIDPETLEASGAPVRVTEGDERPEGMAAGEGAVWIVFPGGLVRIDASTGGVGAPHSSDLVGPIAVGDGVIWVVRSEGDEVQRIDPVSGLTSGAPIELPGRDTSKGTVMDIAVGGGAVWVADKTENTLWRIDAIAR